MFTKKISRRNGKDDKQLSCTIRFLDDSEPLSFTYQKDTKGQEIFDQVCHCLDLAEKDYFGLRYIDLTKQRHWLDLLKPVWRQLKYVNPVVLCFRVKFYPSDPSKLREEITRYFLFLQLRRDLHHGRLICSQNDANLLAAFILQSEVGDYDPEEHLANYVGKFKMLPKQSQRQEEKIRELHRSLMGQSPGEAELNFLQKSATLVTYGVDPHPVKDPNGNLLYLGVTHLGIVIFQGSKRTRIFSWPQVNKITFEGKVFIVHVTLTEVRSTGLFDAGNCVVKKHMYGYKCPTLSACKHLWKCAVEQQYFFTLDSGKNAPKVVSGGGVFTRGSRFRFSGRSEKETYKDELLERDEPRFIRTSANPLFAQRYTSLRSGSVPATFNVLGLSEESLDSLHHYKQGGQWRSLDDFSRASTPHESPIVSEEANDFVYYPKAAEDIPIGQHQQQPSLLVLSNEGRGSTYTFDAGELPFGQAMNSSYHSNFSSGIHNDANELRGQDFKKSDSMLYGSDPVINAKEQPLRKRHRHLLKHQQKTIYDECLDGSAFGTNQSTCATGNNFANNNSSGNSDATKHPYSNGNGPDDGSTSSATSAFASGEAATGSESVGSKRSFGSGRLIRFSVVLILLCCVLAIAIFYLLFGTSADREGDDRGPPDEQAPDDTISSLLGFYGNLDIDDEDL